MHSARPCHGVPQDHGKQPAVVASRHAASASVSASAMAACRHLNSGALHWRGRTGRLTLLGLSLQLLVAGPAGTRAGLLSRHHLCSHTTSGLSAEIHSHISSICTACITPAAIAAHALMALSHASSQQMPVRRRQQASSAVSSCH